MQLLYQLSWLDAYQRCCSYGMTLVDVKDENELKCIYELNNNNCEHLTDTHFKLKIFHTNFSEAYA
jgi:hypothetical protein